MYLKDELAIKFSKSHRGTGISWQVIGTISFCVVRCILPLTVDIPGSVCGVDQQHEVAQSTLTLLIYPVST